MKKNKAKFDSRFKLSPTLQAQASMHKKLSDADIVRQYGSPEGKKTIKFIWWIWCRLRRIILKVYINKRINLWKLGIKKS